MRVSSSTVKGVDPILLLLFCFLCLLWTVSASSKHTPTKKKNDEKPYSAEKQVEILIQSIYAERGTNFPQKNFPIFSELKQVSQLMKLLQKQFDLSDLKDPEKLRKIEHRFKHFKFYMDPNFQMRALLVYPRGTNQYSSQGYLRFVRSFLPLFRDWRNWHIIFNNLSLIQDKGISRLPEIFSSEKEEDMKKQYCAFLNVERQETRERLQELLPALRLGKTYKCHDEEADEESVTDLSNFFDLFDQRDEALDIGSDIESSGKDDTSGSSSGQSVSGDEGEAGNYDEDYFSEDGEAWPCNLDEKHTGKETDGIKVTVHYNQGRFSK